jgi:uncharacterized protein
MAQISVYEKIKLPIDEIIAFCKRNHIQKLSLFGSVLRDDFSDDSDIDVLVEFEPDAVIGWKIVSMRVELAEILGYEVDFLTEGFLSPSFREEVLEQALLIYEQTR